jgi:hypothetical protein
MKKSQMIISSVADDLFVERFFIFLSNSFKIKLLISRKRAIWGILANRVPKFWNKVRPPIPYFVVK